MQYPPPYLNAITIRGQVVRDPDVKTFANGGKIANVCVRTDMSFVDHNGIERVQSQFHNVVVRKAQFINVAEKELRKDSYVLFGGHIATRKYKDRANIDKYVTEIIVGDSGIMTLCDHYRESDAG
jgi:single-strand DNA-binding protein